MEYLHREPDNEGLSYGSVVDYLYEDEGEYLPDRCQKLIDTIDELLVYDDEDIPRGILDDTYLNDHGVRQLAGRNYVQVEDLRHMTFVLNVSAADLVEIDDIGLTGGETVGDMLDAANIEDEISQFNGDSEEVYVARRAYTVRMACKILIEDYRLREQSRSDPA